MDAKQFREGLVRPTLQTISLWSPAAEELLMGTAAQETHLGALGRRQQGGPALGLWQCEPATLKLVMKWARRYRPSIALALYGLADTHEPGPELLVTNDRFACAVARVLYLSIPKPLPDPHDLMAQAVMWKSVYNRGGKGTVEEYISNYRAFVAPGRPARVA